MTIKVGGRRLGAAIVACSMLAAGLMQLPAVAAEPSLGLRAAKDSMVVKRSPRRAAFLELGISVTTESAPFEIHLSRPDYSEPIVVTQVLEGGETRSLPGDTINGWHSFKDFLSLEVTDADGNQVASRSFDFCPNGFEGERINDEGPATRTYPPVCHANPFSRGIVWGIDTGWAASATGFEPIFLRKPDGHYTATMSITPRFVELFGVSPEKATASVDIELKTRKCRRRCGRPHHRTSLEAHEEFQAGIPTLENPDQSMLPDLAALPAWGISTHHNPRNGRDYLTFGATVWTGGSAPLVVEGFRRPGEDLMDAYQYFYQDDVAVGRAPAGALEYDDKRGHNHWHFKQFAAYRLLDGHQQEIVASRKEAFCLVPTDAVDLTLPAAEWTPDGIGFGTNCGSPNSLWVRETLPTGWGDTYFQGLPGQSFNITNLRNGIYYIQVEANPLGLLSEQRSDNNAEVRAVMLRGKPGQRRVIVPPWNGIDSEGDFFGGCC